MKQVLLVLACLVVLLPGVVRAQWTNEPVGSALLLDCNFSGKPSACGITDAYASSYQDSDSTALVSPPGVVRSTMFAGNNFGGMQLNYSAATTYRELYVGLMWRTNPQFQGRQVGNKMFFVGQPGGAGVFLFGNSALVGGQAPMIFVHNSSTLDNSHTCALDFGLACYPNVGSGLLMVGTWTKIEVYVRDSTTKTSRDGILRWWINGVPAGNYTNYNFWATGFNTWIWTETWDGTVNPVPTVDWSHYIDHLHISVPNCVTQPSGCPTSPPPTPVTISLSPSTQPAGTVGTAYSGTTVTASSGTSPYTFTTTGLPAGVTLSSGGVWGGTPTIAGTYSVVVTATDSTGGTPNTGTQTYSMVINPAPTVPVVLSPSTLPAGTVGTAYNQTLTASGGTAPYTFSASGLPPGLTLSTAGVLSGTPTANNTYTVTITVTDSATPTAGTGTRAYPITIATIASGGQVTNTLTISQSDATVTSMQVQYQINGGDWKVAGVLAPNTTSYVHTLPNAGLYRVCYRIISSRVNSYGATLNSGYTAQVCKTFDATIPSTPSLQAVN